MECLALPGFRPGSAAYPGRQLAVGFLPVDADKLVAAYHPEQLLRVFAADDGMRASLSSMASSRRSSI